MLGKADIQPLIIHTHPQTFVLKVKLQREERKIVATI